jgi:hypothetical protein
MPDFVQAIDWTRPWLAPLLPMAFRLLQEDWRQDANAIAEQCELQNHRGLPIRFVPQSNLPEGIAYEAFIGNTGGVPSRENLHDFFNALVWLTFPETKKRLNALHGEEISRTRVSTKEGRPRGKLRDAATIFDENGAVLVARDHAFVDALRDQDWRHVFIERCAGFGRDWEVWLFGHALMEKLAKPYKAITAHALPLTANEAFFSMSFREKLCWMDDAISRHLSRDFRTSDLTPLPVLGVPGWCSGQDEDFYQDATVFRRARQRNLNTK